MSDIMQVLPGFQTTPFAHILPSLDKASISTVDLITLSAAEVAKRAQVPPVEVSKLSNALVQALQESNAKQKSKTPFLDLTNDRESTPHISLLDDELDAAFGGGIKPGYIVEVTGESGVGKTQFLLTLLLAVQLDPPLGLSRSALYISTEAALSTSRLSQLLRMHPQLQKLSPDQKPTLDRVLSIQTPDLESQEHILRYQVPIAIQRHNVGLVVIDSIAANYRAEFERSNVVEDKIQNKASQVSLTSAERRAGQSMAERRPQLVQLGAHLRQLAQKYNIGIVVSNQIADRFTPTTIYSPSHPAPATQNGRTTTDHLTLDLQQRWFTGWGDLPSHVPGHTSLKTPSLGLVWANQINCRIALIKEQHVQPGKEKQRRWMRVVFSPWAASSNGQGVEYNITAEGITTNKHVDP